MRVHKRIRYNYFHTIRFFKRELIYGTWVNAESFMSYDTCGKARKR